jgi:glycosyltransferase involved in cell wall biosynthesis
MVRVLVVSHSAQVRDLVLWRSLLQMDPDVDLVIPELKINERQQPDNEIFHHPRVFSLPAVEPFGEGHSAMWIKGLKGFADSRNYDLIHVAFEPWALIPQTLCGNRPTIIHAAESVLKAAPWQLRVRRFGITRVLNKAAGMLTWGNTSLEEFREIGLPASTPQGVIPVGVPDPKFFFPTLMDVSAGPLRLLFVGRIIPAKGIVTLVKAACGMNRPVTLRVLGEGSLAESLPHLVSGRPDVELLIEGPALAAEVSAAMAWAHVVVIPSEPTSSWKEQWGRVAVEAMLSGRPTVVSDNGELPYLVEEPELVFSAGNADALRTILLRLDENREALPSIGEKLRISADRFDPDRLAHQLIHFWKKIV